MLTKHIDYFRSKPMNMPKITILLDHGYHLDKLREALEEVYPQIMRKIRFEHSQAIRARESGARKDWICTCGG